MPLLNYNNLPNAEPVALLNEVFQGVRPFHDYLVRTIRYLKSDEAILRLDWRDPRPPEKHDPEVEEGTVWVELVEPEDRPNEPDSTFNAFLQDEVQEVYEVAPLEETEGAARYRPKAYKFTRENEIQVLDRDPENNRLLLERLPELPWLLLRPNTHPLECQLRALETLRDSPAPEHRALLQLFESTAVCAWPQVSPVSLSESDWLVLTDPGRPGTAQQRQFVNTALATPDFGILDGPPGSGKTTTLCELILQCLKRGERVLLCASTHVAVDNVLERVTDPATKGGENLIAVRIGDRRNLSDKVKPHQFEEFIRTERRRFEGFLRGQKSPTVAQQILREALESGNTAVEELILSTANLVCGTAIGILQHPELKLRRRQFVSPKFDVLIFDEASKTTFQEFLVPALLAKRWIIVGDPKQLSPYVEEEAVAINLRACLPDLNARRACLAKLLEKRRSAPATEEHTTWENELGWRLTRLHEHRLCPGATSDLLEDDIDLLLQTPREAEVFKAVNQVCRVAFPSIIENLQHGFSWNDSVRFQTALTSGLPPDCLEQRYVLLTYQHRMHPEISAFSRKHVYEGSALLDPEDMASQRSWPYQLYANRAVWIDVPGRFNRRLNNNLNEVATIMKDLREFLAQVRSNPGQLSRPWEVAIIACYRGQERAVRQQLRNLLQQPFEVRHFYSGHKDHPAVRIEVCTVDRFQGHEADLVFITFANDRPTNFLESLNRLNVALTRPRFQRVLVGNRAAMKHAHGPILRTLAETEPWAKSIEVKNGR
ncbi:MAG: heavy metal resistance protein CzcA [Verrucomicrobia bacterium]|nr:MAG: heavy metal resistance protein CzcA [Verrucomicrobiota bacterium]